MSAELRSRIPEIVAESEAKAALAVHKATADIEAEAKARSRVDTGQMRDGWQTRVVGALEMEVFNPVEHTIYNEFGTVSMPAQPMLYPAVDHARPEFEAAVAEIYR